MNFTYSLLITNVLVAVVICFSTLNAEAQTKHALLIGISDYGNAREYQGKWSDINGANDVALLSPLLTKQGYKVRTIADAHATYANIISALKKVVKESRKGDMVYLHFSMHGQPFEDLNDDETDGWDEALIPVDAQMRYVKGKYEGRKHLLDDELKRYIAQIRYRLGSTGQLYVVLDACHAGTLSRGDEHIRGVKEGFSRSGKVYRPDRNKEKNDYFKIKTSAGQSPVVFLEACRSYQRNMEVFDKHSKKWYGSLSYYVAKAMEKYKIDESGEWVKVVKAGMCSDRRLRHQNMVIETSDKNRNGK
ncbi:caspase family protein [Prevotella sp. PINT]|uniref:caspase family protein n=1 Tax=Palleniella intestinalis TaxID=2736291 RepID=UPI001555F967|nr:caspase family protein [Palleniella intestinalis]NPD82384.1 caspase family protein [Palleniella intestinalis]